MFVFGHTGLTLCSAVLLAGFFARNKRQEAGIDIDEDKEMPRTSEGPPASQVGDNLESGGRLMYLADLIDIRVLLIGSLLPDIVDKPVGRVFFRDIFSNGHIFCHTLLFLVFITAVGLVLYQARRQTWLLALAYGTFTHLILDGIWMSPRTFLWPLYGLSFGRYPYSIWLWIESLWHRLYTNPWILIPEIAGALVITWLVWQIVRRRKFLAFLKAGQV